MKFGNVCEVLTVYLKALTDSGFLLSSWQDAGMVLVVLGLLFVNVHMRKLFKYVVLL